MGEEKPKVRILFPKEPAEEPAPKPSVLKFEEPKVEYQADWNPRTNRMEERPGTRKMDPVRPRTLFNPTQVAPTEPVPTRPTTLSLPGMKIRIRIEASIEDLKSKNPDVTPGALEIARASLRLINLEDARTSTFLDVGLEIQEKFAETSSKMLSMTTSPKLDLVNSGLSELRDLLAAAELEQLFSEPAAWKRWFGQAPTFESVKDKLKGKVEEVLDRTVKIRGSMSGLKDLREESGALDRELEELLPKIEAELVVARFLIDHLLATPTKEFYKEWADALQRRSDSILMTRMTLRQAVIQLQMVKQHLRHLTEVVHAALVNMVPAWCGNCVSFISRARAGDDRVKSEMRDLSALRDKIVGILTNGEN